MVSDTVKQRRRRLAEEVINKYRDALLETWMRSVPVAYHGYSVGEHLEHGCWGGHLKNGDVRALCRFMDGPERFVILKGTGGIGKTTLAVTVATEVLLEHDIVPMLRSVPMLLNAFSFDHESNPAQECVDAGLLILDDVGAANEGITAHQMRLLWGVIDQRWAQRKPTIMTTNMPVASSTEGQGMIDWFGPSMWDRIADGLTLVEMSGDSFRSGRTLRAGSRRARA